MINIGVIGKDNDASSSINKIISAYSKNQSLDITVRIYNNPEDFITQGEDNYSMVLVDTDNGDQLEELLESLSKELAKRTENIVFYSQGNTYNQELFAVTPSGFLDKPINKTELEKLLGEVAYKQDNKKKEPTYFRYSVKKKHYMENTEDILYFQHKRRRARIVTQKNNEEQENFFSSSFNKLLEKVPKGEFARSSKNHLINIEKISRLNKDHVLMCNGANIPISPENRWEFFLGLVEYYNKG